MFGRTARCQGIAKRSHNVNCHSHKKSNGPWTPECGKATKTSASFSSFPLIVWPNWALPVFDFEISSWVVPNTHIFAMELVCSSSFTQWHLSANRGCYYCHKCPVCPRRPPTSLRTNSAQCFSTSDHFDVLAQISGNISLLTKFEREGRRCPRGKKGSHK